MELGFSDDLLIGILGLVVVLILGLMMVVLRGLFFSSRGSHNLKKLLDAEENEKAIALVNRLLKKSPQSFVLNYYRAESLRKLGNLEEALESYKKATVLPAKKKEESLRTAATLEAARLLMKLSREREGLSYYLMILENEPENPVALFETAQYYASVNQNQKAREYLETLLQIRPGVLDARFLYGKILFQSGLTSRALKQFELLKNHDFKNPHVFYYYGLCLEALRSPGEAMKAFETALSLEGMKRGERESLQLKLFSLMVKLKKYAEAKEKIEAALNETSSPQILADLHYLFGTLLWETLFEYDSLKQYEKVSQIDPSYKDVKEILGAQKEFLPLSYFSRYFTGDEMRFELSAWSLFGRRNTQLLRRGKDFYLLARGRFLLLLWRHLYPISESGVSDIEVLTSGMLALENTDSLEIFSLAGVADEARDHPFLKRCVLTEGRNFIEFLEDGLNQKDEEADFL